MRTGGTLFPSITLSKMTTTATVTATTASKSSFTPPTTIERSPWHSPVPYLFGGLAAMLGLIAFALLILACSYWKLSGQVNGGDDGGDRDVEGGAEKGESGADAKASPVFEEKFLVIMAGDVNPTFLATPMSSKVSSFNDDHEKSNGGEGEENEKPKDRTAVIIQENGEFSQESQLRSQEQSL